MPQVRNDSFDSVYSVFLAFSIRVKNRKNTPVVTAAARKSDTGSARNTAKALSAKKWGRIKIRGISRMIFRRQAISRQNFHGLPYVPDLDKEAFFLCVNGLLFFLRLSARWLPA